MLKHSDPHHDDHRGGPGMNRRGKRLIRLLTGLRTPHRNWPRWTNPLKRQRGRGYARIAEKQGARTPEGLRTAAEGLGDRRDKPNRFA